jgi:hypothetical protein
MELIRQLWTTSAPFRVLICVTGVSLILAVTTGNQQTDSVDTSAVDAIAPATDSADSGGLLGQIKQHLPGGQPATPVGQATKVAKDVTDIGAKVGTQATKAGIDAAGELADQFIGGIGK